MINVSLYLLTEQLSLCFILKKMNLYVFKGIIGPIWTISKYLDLSENQTVSCPPVAIGGQKSPAGLISLRKCTGNLSIILSLSHPCSPHGSWPADAIFPWLSCGVGNTRFPSRARLQTPRDAWGLLSWLCGCYCSSQSWFSGVSSRKLFILLCDSIYGDNKVTEVSGSQRGEFLLLWI